MSLASAPTPLPLTIGVTGHRDVRNDDFSRVREVFAAWLEDLAKTYPNTPLRLLTGLAEGADRIAARTFLETRQRLLTAGVETSEAWELVALLPMPAEAYRDDFPNSAADFDDLLRRADAVVTLPSPGVEEMRARPELRIESYKALARHLLRHANVIAAIWDGKYLTLRAGTSHIVQMKLEGSEATQSSYLVAMRDRGPVWHLPVRRSNATDAQEPKAPEWLYPGRFPTFEGSDREKLALHRRFQPQGQGSRLRIDASRTHGVFVAARSTRKHFGELGTARAAYD